MNRLLGVAAVVCLMVIGLGCAAVQKPTASFKSMVIKDVSASGFTMNVDVDVANPNSVALPLTNADYSLALGGVKVIDGAKVKPMGSLPAKGSSVITIPVPLTFEHLLSAEESIRKGGGDLKYGIDAGLDFDSGVPVLGVQRVPFKYEGTFSVTSLLKNNMGTIMSSPAAKKLAEKVLGGFFKF